MNIEQLTGVIKNYAGEIISFETSSGRIISYRKALQEVEEGIITGVEIQETEDAPSSFDFDFKNLTELPELH